MQDASALQATQAPSGEGKADTHTIPLKTQFEQLQSSEQGLTGQEARRRLDTYGPNDTTSKKREFWRCAVFAPVLEPIDIDPVMCKPRLGNPGRSG